jgi:hypothetical protein
MNGDVPQEHLDLAKELKAFEVSVDRDPLPKERKAQMYVCLAHDWYDIDMEEEGDRLLVKSSLVCPGYFSSTVIEHQRENEEFDLIIRQLTSKLLNLLTDTVRNKCG